jgi:hypothetical protein
MNIGRYITIIMGTSDKLFVPLLRPRGEDQSLDWGARGLRGGVGIGRTFRSHIRPQEEAEVLEVVRA